MRTTGLEVSLLRRFLLSRGTDEALRTDISSDNFQLLGLIQGNIPGL